MQEQFGFIYRITNRVNGKSYIGQTCRPVSKRWVQHLYHARKLKKYPLHCAIRKYGVDSFVIETLCECPKAFLNCLEVFFIQTNNSLLSRNGYNVTPGGDGLGVGEQSPNFGKKYSKEHREKISNARKGIKFSEDHKAKLSKSHGKHNAHKWTQESRNKLSKTRSGMKFSDAHRENIRKAVIKVRASKKAGV